MGIHSQRYSLIRVPQLLAHGSDVGPGRDCNTSKGVAQLVGVKVLDTVFLYKTLHVPCGEG